MVSALPKTTDSTGSDEFLGLDTAIKNKQICSLRKSSQFNEDVRLGGEPNRIELLPFSISHPRVSSISGKHVSRHSAAAATGSYHVAAIRPQTRYSNLKLCSMNNRKYFPFGDLVSSMRTSAWVVNRIASNCCLSVSHTLVSRPSQVSISVDTPPRPPRVDTMKHDSSSD
jgi:hypothetical protein